jgi:protocatechuate 3,4-dioxygenase beta subunit
MAAILAVSGSQKMGAQTTATLSGTIQDSSGNVIAGAQVTLTDEATSVSHKIQSNKTGLFAFPSLVPGTYSVEATAKGFAPKKITGIVLHPGDQSTVPSFELAVGSENQTVTVEADEDQIHQLWFRYSGNLTTLRSM